MLSAAHPITLTTRQRAVLEQWVARPSKTPHRLWVRCQIILLSDEGLSNAQQARTLRTTRKNIQRWRARWHVGADALAQIEDKQPKPKDYAAAILTRLQDAPRSGRPPIFSAEQLAQIIALACTKPEEAHRPVDRWTPRELAEEATRRGIVEQISPRHIDRLLKGGRSDPTKADTG